METQQENTTADTSPATLKAHAGSCHCGAVHFQVRLADAPTGSRCNCTICTKTAMTSAAVTPAAFQLLSGEGSLGAYEWGGKTARRFFCKHCGVHCFARGHLVEMGGDYVSVNVNALDDVDAAAVKVVYWDGRHNNWHAGPRQAPWPVLAEGVAV